LGQERPIRENLIGQPDPDHILTSYVERQNLSVRVECKRFARLTLVFSKKLGESQGIGRAALSALQFRARASDAALYARHGRWRDGSAMVG
jgi:hypothetical protein